MVFATLDSESLDQISVYPMPLTTLSLLLLMAFAVGESHRALFLSSFSRVASEKFASLVLSMTRTDLDELIYIPTAAYTYDPTSPRSRGEQRRRARYDAKQKMNLIAASLSVSRSILLELDAANCSPSLLREKLAPAKVIYVDGGNTFYLQKHILGTSFWETAKTALTEGSLYIGSSAGAIVAGRSIKTAFWKGWDDPGVAEDVVWGEDTLRGAGLSDFSVFPHYEASTHDELIAERRGELGHQVMAIANHQVLVCHPGEKSPEVIEF